MPDSFPMIADPWFYAAAFPAVLITGMSKGGFGPGTSLIALPLLGSLGWLFLGRPGARRQLAAVGQG